jgi:hypothetical protein
MRHAEFISASPQTFEEILKPSKEDRQVQDDMNQGINKFLWEK